MNRAPVHPGGVGRVEKGEVTTRTLLTGSHATATHALQAKREDLFSPLMINIGPSHPAMHGTIRIAALLEGEIIRDADVQVGFLHRGFEKECEQRLYNQDVIYTDRLNYVSPMICNVGFCLAVESLLQVEVPDRCKYLRVIASEISRISDHLTNIGAFSMELGALTIFLYLIKARELMYDLHEALCGARVTTNYCRVGGVAADMPKGFADQCRRSFAAVRQILAETHELATRNPLFVQRLRGTGVIGRKEAISLGVTGPILRATGVPYDVRKDQPYLVYDRLAFEVPVAEEGDNLARYLIRMEEIEQSMRLVEQSLEQMPDGLYYVDDPAVFLPPKEEVYGSIEGLMSHFKLIMPGHGVRVPAGETYVAVEGGTGELGFYIVSDGSEKPYRVHCRSPGFVNMGALREMIIGGYVADLVPTFGSVNMIGGETDR